MQFHDRWMFGRWWHGLRKGDPMFFGLGPVSIKIGNRDEDHPAWTALQANWAALKSSAAKEGETQ